MRNNYLKYHESISKEFEATRDRVRYFIENRHHGEDGRYKEILLMNYLRKVLPSNVSVGTGFVRNGTEITNQIDLIVYDNSIPTLFTEGDFVIVLSESVLGIIEVKTKLTVNNCMHAIEKSHKNGLKISENIFNGVFGFDSSVNFVEDGLLNERIGTTLRSFNGYLNHISFGSDYFMKYWDTENPEEIDGKRCFSFYKLNSISFGYFISNLIEIIHVKSNKKHVSSNLRGFLYPISEGKETLRLKNLEVKIDVPFP